MADQKGNKVPKTGRKRARRKESGSQTEDDEVNESCDGCHSMADTIIEVYCKLDLVLVQMEEIEEIKEKQKQLAWETTEKQSKIFQRLRKKKVFYLHGMRGSLY